MLVHHVFNLSAMYMYHACVWVMHEI